jgi:predicted SAM-dependent methyltransferase
MEVMRPMGAFKAKLHDAGVSVASRLRARRRIDPERQPVKINVGSGLVVAPEWIHVDVGLPFLFASFPRAAQRWLYRRLPDSSAARRDFTEDEFVAVLSEHQFVHHRVEYGLPFENGVATHVYTSHLLEHLFLSHARSLLRECYRVLRPGGVLRVCVPDLSHALALFRNGDARGGLEYFFYDSTPSAFTRHRYMYDFAILEEELRGAGFQHVARVAYREGRTPDLERLDNRPDETLFVEAEKARPD